MGPHACWSARVQLRVHPFFLWKQSAPRSNFFAEKSCSCWQLPLQQLTTNAATNFVNLRFNKAHQPDTPDSVNSVRCGPEMGSVRTQISWSMIRWSHLRQSVKQENSPSKRLAHCEPPHALLLSHRVLSHAKKKNLILKDCHLIVNLSKKKEGKSLKVGHFKILISLNTKRKIQCEHTLHKSTQGSVLCAKRFRNQQRPFIRTCHFSTWLWKKGSCVHLVDLRSNTLTAKSYLKIQKKFKSSRVHSRFWFSWYFWKTWRGRGAAIFHKMGRIPGVPK